MRKIVIVAGVLALLFSSTLVSSKSPYISQPIEPSAFVPVVIDPNLRTIPPVVVKPTLEPTPVIKPKNTPAPKIQPPKINISRTHVISGIASWYCLPGVSRCTYTHPSGGYYAAIRKDLLGLMGKNVIVCAGKGNCVSVKIIDCNCGKNANLIDLYYDAFDVISNPSLGRIPVTLSW